MPHTRASLVRRVSAMLLAFTANAQAQAPTPQTHSVVVDGHVMRAQSYGLAERKPGAPVVLFEAGASQPLDIWDPVAPHVAGSAAVVTYDRAGLGQSAWDGQRPTPQHVAARLTALLQEIDAPPPYVIVGYSWGGVLARYFAGLHPDAVVGIVYVDPGPIVTQTHADEMQMMEETGATTAQRDSLLARIGRLDVPEAARAEFEVFTDLMRVDVPERGLLSVPPVPAAMIVAGRHLPLPPMIEVPYDQAARFDAELPHRMRLLSQWVLPSPGGMLVMSRTVTHAVPTEDPELITWAVTRVLNSVTH